MPRVLTSFVRNKLVSEVYLPLVGANLAKQLGAAGDQKRTDRMGMLLLISPPGYGKTTLMEYVANRLGLVFMKVNGPALGHEVVSLDPAEAPNATARQEVEKVNLALEMGNNVMLYLDDIQHTNPEFLQKFISLCDAQRRIEGVWRGKTRTYDLRGKKFCVVMAGNPYTESGEAFKIPDMLANRADTYNLGDILGGQADAFALSYVENALTSNRTLAPLATREQADVYKLRAHGEGRGGPGDRVLARLLGGRGAGDPRGAEAPVRGAGDAAQGQRAVHPSAAMDDQYRTEPPFKLQGSYRNMNKLAEKVVAAMTTDELERLVDDHYQGEAQTLTIAAEQNLLKLAELRGRQTPEQLERWTTIKREFVRGQRRRASGEAADGRAAVVGPRRASSGRARRSPASPARSRPSARRRWRSRSRTRRRRGSPSCWPSRWRSSSARWCRWCARRPGTCRMSAEPRGARRPDARDVAGHRRGVEGQVPEVSPGRWRWRPPDRVAQSPRCERRALMLVRA
jgi:hypothetical protein